MPDWFLTGDGDVMAYEMYRRHYSAKNKNPKLRQFVGPGEKVVLITENDRAVFAWRNFIDDTEPPQEGICCTIFRNEKSGLVSSELIRQACRVADALWPNQRRYTFINPTRIDSQNPGYCFKQAGWKLVRDGSGKPVKTKDGLLILELAAK